MSTLQQRRGRTREGKRDRADEREQKQRERGAARRVGQDLGPAPRVARAAAAAAIGVADHRLVVRRGIVVGGRGWGVGGHVLVVAVVIGIRSDVSRGRHAGELVDRRVGACDRARGCVTLGPTHGTGSSARRERRRFRGARQRPAVCFRARPRPRRGSGRCPAHQGSRPGRCGAVAGAQAGGATSDFAAGSGRRQPGFAGSPARRLYVKKPPVCVCVPLSGPIEGPLS